MHGQFTVRGRFKASRIEALRALLRQLLPARVAGTGCGSSFRGTICTWGFMARGFVAQGYPSVLQVLRGPKIEHARANHGPIRSPYVLIPLPPWSPTLRPTLCKQIMVAARRWAADAVGQEGTGAVSRALREGCRSPPATRGGAQLYQDSSFPFPLPCVKTLVCGSALWIPASATPSCVWRPAGVRGPI